MRRVLTCIYNYRSKQGNICSMIFKNDYIMLEVIFEITIIILKTYLFPLRIKNLLRVQILVSKREIY